MMISTKTIHSFFISKERREERRKENEKGEMRRERKRARQARKILFPRLQKGGKL